ncbi:pro-adrenomedullin [Engraulis encrasicolus]|uniref:pro-adrenomedullin n=1 Tax=Engraulis encrasicolus TaxID=184585 RepID=UPI002FD3A26C
MKLFLQCVLFWGVLATLARCSRGSQPELSAETRKRLSVWMQSLVRRDIQRRLVEREEGSVQENRSSKPLPAHLRFKRMLNSKPSGCNLVTCSVHELAHRLHIINKNKADLAPQSKISEHGYGRRRRRSLEQLFTSLSSSSSSSSSTSQRSRAQLSRLRTRRSSSSSSSSSRRGPAFRRT